MPSMKRNSRGFNLLELMVAITILGILLGISVPTFREFSRNNSVTAAQNDLVTTFSLARSEALRRNRPVSVCASADGAACGDETNWSSGWIAFTDRSVAGVVDGDDVTLQIWQSPNSNLAFSSASPFVQYLATGMSSAATTIEVSYTGCSGLHKRSVEVTVTGAVTSRKVTC
jgi:type IV fimbrial biogenesis protein FimT